MCARVLLGRLRRNLDHVETRSDSLQVVTTGGNTEDHMDSNFTGAQPEGTESGARDDSPKVHVWTIRDLLAREVQIPDYQRPYTWGRPQVADLVNDILNFTTSGRYRLGTVILHSHGAHSESGEPMLDVVDGQQRLTTLHLLIRVLREFPADVDPGGARRQSDSGQAEVVKLPLGSAGAEQSIRQVLTNRDHLRTLLGGWPPRKREDFIRALLDECEVLVLQLNELDGAFQMFDSQNSRGKALYPTDLLKAFHLRELGADDQAPGSVRELVRLWEAIPPQHVHALFGNYLFPIKQWALGRRVPREGFTTESIGRFKGIRERDASNQQNRWAHGFMYAKNFTDDFASENAALVRFGMLNPLEYPYQIDQSVLNGETFFRMVDHYYRQGRHLGLASLRTFDAADPDDVGSSRPASVERLDQRTKVGHEDPRYAYIRLMVDCLLLYYTDRFGTQKAEDFARLATQYALVPRATTYAVRWESVNNHAVDGMQDQTWRMGLFQHIRDAQSPRDVLDHFIPQPTMYDGRRGVNPDDKALVDHYWSAAASAEAS